MSRNNIRQDIKIKVLVTIIIALLLPNSRLVLCAYIETRQLCGDCGYIKLPCQQDMFTYFFYHDTILQLYTNKRFDFNYFWYSAFDNEKS